MKFCPNCGGGVTEGSKFCPNCGYMMADYTGSDTLPEKEIFPDPDRKTEDIFGAAPKKNVFETGDTEKTPSLESTPFDSETHRSSSYSGSYGSEPSESDGPSSLNGFALASLILGIAGFFLNTLLFIPGILAVVFGIIGMNHVKTCNSGRGMSIAGIVLGIISLSLYVVLIICAVVFSFVAISL